MIRIKPLPEISYFRLSLTEFLRTSHPERLSDERFIASRADEAATLYARALRDGSSQEQARTLANEVLFEGLHFSRYDTLTGILWNEFAGVIPEEAARLWAIRLLPVCEPYFAQYALSDDFAYTSEYETLYTELVGTIALFLEEEGYGIQ
jgi:hypothetical protein